VEDQANALGTGKVGLVHDPAIGRTAATEAKDGTRVAEDAQIEGNVRRDYHGTRVTGKEMRMALRQRMAIRASACAHDVLRRKQERRRRRAELRTQPWNTMGAEPVTELRSPNDQRLAAGPGKPPRPLY
jgi:hypothetical protein